MNVDDPVGPGWIQRHEHSFSVRFDKQLFECGGMVVIQTNDDHASVAGFTTGIDGDVIAIVERFVVAGVVHAFSDDFQHECVLTVPEGTRYPFFGVTRGEIVDRFGPVAGLYPRDQGKQAHFVRRGPRAGTGRSHFSFRRRFCLTGVHIETDALKGLFTVKITHGYIEGVCNGAQVFCGRIDFATSNPADGGLSDSGFFSQLHLCPQMGGLFHELVESFSDDFLGFSLHKAYLSHV